ncbi:NAD(P)/FAD-dependent oxidoreductase [Deinococcus aerophilus]|uniref:FAD-dependent oxidoreductase n=1 Tax=Deinococcus aerophilus TaxID=522488 RepID=A0ABQ2GXH8_9DEIO|nr:FAD-dependent oxidoreductase [Deinococcus aerophilus]GGM15773.1 FAD-dependent oxidoreductase [Deinococcus aerophilus]
MSLPATTADALVIGAGIMGAACAARLSERGLRVTLLEAQASPALGSTGRSAAGVRTQFTSATNILLSQHSVAEYAALPQAEYRPIGYLLLVPQTGWKAHAAGVERQQALGAPTQVLTPHEAQAILEFDTDGIHACTFGPADGVVDPHGITYAFLEQARAGGAALHLNTPVTALERRGEDWHATTPAGTFQAPLLINASGAWSGELAALAGFTLPVWPARRMVYATGPLPRPRAVPMTFDLSSGVWLRSEGQRVILGRADPADRGWREGLNWDWLPETLEPALERFPWLADAGLDRHASWWGYYEMTPDELPIVGRMPGVPGWLNACGFSGHGVMQAAAVGRVTAQEALGEPPFINVDSLRFERFGRAEAGVRDIQV